MCVEQTYGPFPAYAPICMDDDEFSYSFYPSKVPIAFGRINPAVRAQLFSKVRYQQQAIIDYKSAPAYEEGSQSYAALTFGAHVGYVKEVLSHVPHDWTIVAPADGLGVVAAAWPGDVVSGDLVHTEKTDTRTFKESIESTLARGLLSPSRNKLFLYSYCLCFSRPQFSEIERISRSHYSIILDCVDWGLGFRRCSSLIYVGPFVPGIPIPDYRYMSHRWELKRKGGAVLYTENLLKIPDPVECFRHDSTVDYLTAMRPGLRICPMEDQRQYISRNYNLVQSGAFTTLHTSLDCFIRNHGPLSYCSFLGRPVDFEQVKSVKGFPSKYSSRTIYRCSSSLMAMFESALIMYSVHGDDLYFCEPLVSKQYRVRISGEGYNIDGYFDFRPD